jgi:hypothetical protein
MWDKETDKINRFLGSKMSLYSMKYNCLLLLLYMFDMQNYKARNFH